MNNTIVKFLFAAALSLTSVGLYAQSCILYSYDASGNRKARRVNGFLPYLAPPVDSTKGSYGVPTFSYHANGNSRSSTTTFIIMP